MTVALPACFDLRPGWLAPAEADELFEQLLSADWEQPQVTVFGRSTPIPRQSIWYGDAVYVYSGTTNEPRAWPAHLDQLRRRLEAGTGCRYNSCLANLYRDGHDTVGWHADDEPGLGAHPTIASVSLGATRDFRVRRRADGEAWTIPLGHGDVLVMSGESQADYQHSIPRRARAEGARVNLTFRWFG